MFQVIYDWMKNILFFMICTTVILQLVPKSYKKYAKFITGIILIIFIINPLLKIIDKSGNFNFALNSYENLFSAKENASYIDNAEDIRNSAVMNEYKKLLAGQTSQLLMTKGLSLISIELELEEIYGDENYGKIKNMYIIAGYQKEEANDTKVPDIVIEQIIVTIGEDNKNTKKNEENIQGHSALEISAKNMIADFYNLETSHINIIIREDNNG